MCCKDERAETIDGNEAAESTQQASATGCPCGHCPKNAKWVCMAGLAAALGLVAFRTFRQASASS